MTLLSGEARRLSVRLGKTAPPRVAADRPASARPAAASERPAATDAPASTSASPAATPERAPATASLRVTSDPAGALVTIDGKPVGNTPLVANALAPGTHDIVVEATGYAPERTRATLRAGQQAEVSADLAARMGFVEIDAPPGSTISIDGLVRMERARSLYRTGLRPGLHRVEFVDPSGARTEQTVDVRAGVTFRVTPGRRAW